MASGVKLTLKSQICHPLVFLFEVSLAWWQGLANDGQGWPMTGLGHIILRPLSLLHLNVGLLC